MLEILVGTVLTILILAGILYVLPEDLCSVGSLATFVTVFVFLMLFMRSK